MMHQITSKFKYSKERKMPQSVSILISNYNHSRFVKMLVYMIAYSQSVYPKKLEVVIADSGSNQENQDIIKELQEAYRGILRIKYIYIDTSNERSENLRFNGYAFCVNAAAKEAQGEVLIHCDSSIIVPPTYIEAMTSPHVLQPNLFVRAGLTNYNEEQTKISLEQWHYTWKQCVELLGPTPKFSLGRPAWSVRKEAFNQIGGMDESMQTYGAIDDDFVTRLMMAGYKNVEADVFVIHQFHIENRQNDGINTKKMQQHCVKRTIKVATQNSYGWLKSNFETAEVHDSWQWINGQTACSHRNNIDNNGI